MNDVKVYGRCANNCIIITKKGARNLILLINDNRNCFLANKSSNQKECIYKNILNKGLATIMNRKCK